MTKNSVTANNLIFSEREGFKNALCLPLLSFFGEFLDSEQLLNVEEFLLSSTKDKILSALGVTSLDLEEIYNYIVLKSLSRDVVEINLVALDYNIAKKVLKRHNIEGLIYVRTKDFLSLAEIKELNKEDDLGLFTLPYFDDESHIYDTVNTSAKLNAPVVAQFFEDLTRTGEINSRTGLLPINFLEDLGLLDRDISIFGGVYADKDDLCKLKEYDAKMIVYFYDSLNLGRASANIYQMQSQGLEVMLSSPISLDIKEEAKLASILTRSSLADSSVMNKEQAKALGISKKTKQQIDFNELNISRDKIKKIFNKIKEKF